MDLIGKAEPYRTSSGKAAGDTRLKNVSKRAYSASSVLITFSVSS